MSELLVLDPLMIVVPEGRLRAVDPDKVQELALSIMDTGQITPIRVAPRPDGRYELIAGAHRLAAMIEANQPEIEATIFEGTADQRRLLEIDENLYRAELTAYDQAAFLTERRAIYERLNGPVKPGRKGRPGNSDTLSQLTFFDDVTKKFGLPRRTIERALKRRSFISTEVWHRLRGHPVTKNASELDKLAKLNEAEQRKVVKLLTQEAHPAKNVSAALRALSDAPVIGPDERQLQRLTDAWRKAGAKARADFRTFLEREGAREAAL